MAGESRSRRFFHRMSAMYPGIATTYTTPPTTAAGIIDIHSDEKHSIDSSASRYSLLLANREQSNAVSAVCDSGMYSSGASVKINRSTITGNRAAPDRDARQQNRCGITLKIPIRTRTTTAISAGIIIDRLYRAWNDVSVHAVANVDSRMLVTLAVSSTCCTGGSGQFNGAVAKMPSTWKNVSPTDTACGMSRVRPSNRPPPSSDAVAIASTAITNAPIEHTMISTIKRINSAADAGGHSKHRWSDCR